MIRRSRMGALALASALLMGTGLVASAAGPQASPDLADSTISTSEFAAPAAEFRPGVRWWWSGGSVETDVLAEQLEYLASHGFGYVEINPFGKQLPAEDPAVGDIYTESFYEKLEFAVAKAQELGITVDLNMGSGWNANSQYVDLDEAEGNFALGRSTLTGEQLLEGSVAVPPLAKSMHYGDPMPAFAPELSTLQGVLVAERTGEAGAITGDAALFDDGATVWDTRVVLSKDANWFIDVAQVQDGAVTLAPDAIAEIDPEAEYEVVALYHLPAGSNGVDSAKDWFVIDHMNKERTANYIHEWVGDPNLKAIVDGYDNVRALFNDSLELHTDLYYTEALYDLAGDAEANGLGYDFTPYLPTVFRQNLGLPAYRGGSMGGSLESYLTFAETDDEARRILADYQRLAGQKFSEGLQGFQEATNEYGLLYRQQAYNPPMDIIGAAEYVDIPEDEQHDEYRLLTVASGAHLYDRNLVTAEQFTLGLTPFQNSLDSLKVGVDLMATGGVNNFFYHGLSYAYGVGTEEYGENGWSPMATIGVGMQQENTLSKYFPELNAYASRLQYVLQQGSPSSDVAVYAPFNTRAIAAGATPVLNANGYTWDVINDASITNSATTYADGKLVVNGGNMEYDALIVHTSTVPVDTMESLLELAENGAPILFFGDLPNAQSGYAAGEYAAEDAKVAALADQIVAQQSGHHPADASALAATLGDVVDPELTFDTNENVRSIRRTLDNGAEVMFIRNTAATPNTITVEAGDEYANFYWLDQEDGSIYAAEVEDGELTFTLDPGGDALGRGATPANPSKGIILLAEPAGSGFEAGEVSEGLPAAVDRVQPDWTTQVSPDSLTVTADNLDGIIGGEVTTKVYTENVLGNWKDPDFQDGELQSVVSDGVYSLSINVPDVGDRYVLNLGEVFSAATVTVNGEVAGTATWAPFEVDLTEYLAAGTNEIEVAVTPRMKNRYYPAATNASGQYSMAAPQDAGLVGPIAVHRFAVPPSVDPTPTVTVTASPSPQPTVTVTAGPQPGRDLYETPGFHRVNGRSWMTACEPYSSTVDRCWTYIWGTTIHESGGRFTQVNGWAFNNLTYIGGSRADWSSNPLGFTNRWTAADGRQWRTECDTANTGRNGCRSYNVASVIERQGNTFRYVSKEVFNNQVRFR